MPACEFATAAIHWPDGPSAIAPGSRRVLAESARVGSTCPHQHDERQAEVQNEGTARAPASGRSGRLPPLRRPVVYAAIVLAVLAAFLFGSGSPLSKLILNNISPFQLAGLLYLGAALGVGPRLILRKELTPFRRVSRKSRWLLIGAISCGGILGPLGLLFGLKIGQASSVSL